MSDAIATTRARKFSVPLFLRTLVGLILAPIVGGGIVIGGTGLIDSGGGDPQLGSLMFIGAYIGAAYGVAPALLIGWPIHLFLLRQRWTHPLVYIGLGAGIGVSALVLIGVLEGLS